MGDATANMEKRRKYRQVEQQLRNDISSLLPRYRELSDFISPERSRFFVSKTSNYTRKDQNIINSECSLASRVFQSGMMAGVTSPARPWFQLAIGKKELSETDMVKTYLADATQVLREAFIRSNLYTVLSPLYGDLGDYGTGCIFMDEDMEDVFNFHCFPVGSFMISNDKKGRARVFFREFKMTVRQIVDKFGRTNPDKPNKVDWTNISESVQNLYKNNQQETWINVAHMVKPNDDYDPNKLESKFQEFISVYYEQGTSANSPTTDSSSDVSDKILQEKGYDYYPVLAVRWETVGEDAYGSRCPGMIAIGDVKQLQHAEKRSAQAIDQKVKPSMIGPTSLRKASPSQIPGKITYHDEREGQAGFRRLYEMNFEVSELEAKNNQIMERIQRAYFVDLFRMISSSDRRQITAREIEEKHEEKLLGLGPVLQRIDTDLLDLLIGNAFLILQKRGALPELPEELEGQEYSVEYISIMAQAQKLAEAATIERFMGFLGQAAQFDPALVQKANLEEMLERYANIIGIDPDLLRTTDEFAQLVQAQQEQQQQLQQQAEQSQMVDSAKTLSETDTEGSNALTELLKTTGAEVA